VVFEDAVICDAVESRSPIQYAAPNVQGGNMEGKETRLGDRRVGIDRGRDVEHGDGIIYTIFASLADRCAASSQERLLDSGTGIYTLVYKAACTSPQGARA
jgi:hypothetical protein